MKSELIPVIDIFAGPGGLAEGFAAFEHRRRQPFSIALSIERDPIACKTLLLRKMVRAWKEIPDAYIDFQRGDLSMEDLIRRHPVEHRLAAGATRCAELGGDPEPPVSDWIQSALGSRPRPWVLVGGPPCQAYSLVGRSRMRGTEGFEKDKRHTLYREYLRIVARHRPAAFVMENVKGILSSKLEGQKIFQKILEDLRAPGRAVRGTGSENLAYRLYGLGGAGEFSPLENPESANEFLVRAEEYGIPQTRHRVFVVGLRSDLQGRPEPLEPRDTVHVGSVLADLPAVRSRLSGESDGQAEWIGAVEAIERMPWMRAGRDSPLRPVADRVKDALDEIRRRPLSSGGRFLSYRARPKLEPDWFRGRANGITLHETKAHMRSDLHRYLFAAAYTSEFGKSPKLREFPSSLHPDHANIAEAIEGDKFGDRFRVQRAGSPSTTITSHLSKDGHYYIHYDPAQCRSLTVREAARLQTFPDDYFFVGNRTQQYVQVGNAVPPLLARQVAASVFALLEKNERRK